MRFLGVCVCVCSAFIGETLHSTWPWFSTVSSLDRDVSAQCFGVGPIHMCGHMSARRVNKQTVVLAGCRNEFSWIRWFVRGMVMLEKMDIVHGKSWLVRNLNSTNLTSGLWVVGCGLWVVGCELGLCSSKLQFDFPRSNFESNRIIKLKWMAPHSIRSNIDIDSLRFIDMFLGVKKDINSAKLLSHVLRIVSGGEERKRWIWSKECVEIQPMGWLDWEYGLFNATLSMRIRSLVSEKSLVFNLND